MKSATKEAMIFTGKIIWIITSIVLALTVLFLWWRLDRLSGILTDRTGDLGNARNLAGQYRSLIEKYGRFVNAESVFEEKVIYASTPTALSEVKKSHVAYINHPGRVVTDNERQRPVLEGLLISKKVIDEYGLLAHEYLYIMFTMSKNYSKINPAEQRFSTYLFSVDGDKKFKELRNDKKGNIRGVEYFNPTIPTEQ